MTVQPNDRARARFEDYIEEGLGYEPSRGEARTVLDALAAAEAERDEWRQTALDERAAALDALEQLKLRDAQIKAAQTALNYRPEETP